MSRAERRDALTREYWAALSAVRVAKIRADAEGDACRKAGSLCVCHDNYARVRALVADAEALADALAELDVPSQPTPTGATP